MEETTMWDSASFLLDLSRFGVLDIRRKSDADVKLPAATLLDKVYVQEQSQLLHAPFAPELLQRLRAGAPPRLRLHACLGTVRYRRNLRLSGERKTQMAVEYELYLQFFVRKFIKEHIHDISEDAEAARWVPPEERTAERPHPFVAVPTLEALAQSVKSDISPPVLHVFQCLVDWPLLLGVHDILNMRPAQANKADAHVMLVLVMSDLSQAYYFDPAGHSCIGSRFWRRKWELALGRPLQDLVRTRRRGGEAWGPQLLPALLRQPNRELNVSSQWCYAWCTMVTGLLVWNCVQDAAGAEKIGAYLYAKRAKLQTLSIGTQAKYMDRKIRNFVLYMHEIRKQHPPVTTHLCDQKWVRRRPPSVHPVANVYEHVGDDQLWRDLKTREFSPVLAAHSVDDDDAENAPPPPVPRSSVDALTPPRKPRPRRGGAPPPLEEQLGNLHVGGGGGTPLPPSPASACRRQLVDAIAKAWGGLARPCLLRVPGARAARACPTNEEMNIVNPSSYVYVGGPLERSPPYSDNTVATLLCAADGGVAWVTDNASEHAHLPAVHLDLGGACPPGPAGSTAVPDSENILRRCRTIKTQAEIDCIARAVGVTRRALRCVEAYVRRRWARGTPVTEIEIGKVFELAAAQRGGGVAPLGFPTIVSTGAGCGSRDDAVELHPAPSMRVVPPGAPVVVDAGCRCRGYCADVTVTLGCDAAPWSKLHQSLARAVGAVVAAIRTDGSQTLDDVEALAAGEMTTVLRDNALPFDEKGLRALMPHRATHHLGLDVHDFCDDSMPLAPGMVLAVELGVYIPNDTDYPPFPRGGVRVETDVVLEAAGGARELP